MSSMSSSFFRPCWSSRSVKVPSCPRSWRKEKFNVFRPKPSRMRAVVGTHSKFSNSSGFLQMDIISKSSCDALLLCLCRCQICFCDYTDGEKLRMLPCFHDYHMKCIDRWLKVNTHRTHTLTLSLNNVQHFFKTSNLLVAPYRTTPPVLSAGPIWLMETHWLLPTFDLWPLCSMFWRSMLF